MNQEVKDLWTGGLRSGEFQQGEGHLDQHGRQCCLGVLCILAIRAGVEVDVFTDVGGIVYYDGETDFLPQKVMDWAGLDHSNPEVTFTEYESEHVNSLSYINDEVDGGTFERIAGLIDAQL